MKKKCTLCKLELPTDVFNRRALSKDGLQNVCRECNKIRSRKYYKENTKKHRNVTSNRLQQMRNDNTLELHMYLMRSGGCADCDETNPVVMEFDHIKSRGAKLGELSDMLRTYKWGHQRLVDELAKCDIVCANCHRKRTALRANWRKHVWNTLTRSSSLNEDGAFQIELGTP